jgi:hypothetical protein
MSRKTKFKKGDRVVLLSVPGVTDDSFGPAAVPTDIGLTFPVDRVRFPAADGTIWYDVAGWVVQAADLEAAS